MLDTSNGSECRNQTKKQFEVQNMYRTSSIKTIYHQCHHIAVNLCTNQSTSDKALPVQVGIQMGLQKRFHSIVQYTRRAAPAVLYCLGRAHEMMSRLAQTLSNKVISNYLHSAFVCRFFSCSQALQPTNNHGRSTQQQQ